MGTGEEVGGQGVGDGKGATPPEVILVELDAIAV